MSNKCRCRWAKLSPHRKEKCFMFGRDGVLISPDASDALYNKPIEATPVDPMENSKPSGEDPPSAVDQKSTSPAPAENQESPLPADDGQNIPPPTTSTEGNSSPPRDAEAGESSEAAQERLEKLVAEAIRGANLPPGTSINVTINVNTPEPPLPSGASAGGPTDKDDVIFEAEYIDVHAEPVGDLEDLKEQNDILASVSIEPTSPLAVGYSLATPVSPANNSLGYFEYVRSEESPDEHAYVSVSPARASPLPAPVSTLPHPVHTVLASLTPVLSIVPPSPPTATMAHIAYIAGLPQSPVVPVSPAFQAEIEEPLSIEDLMASCSFGEEPNLNAEDESDYEEQAL